MILRLGAMALILGGYLGLLERLGATRPLNRLAAVVAWFSAIGLVGWVAISPAQPALGLIYVVGLPIAWLITSVAVLHRPGVMRRIGLALMIGTGGPLAVLIAGHVALGGFGFLGVGLFRGRAGAADLVLWPAEAVIAGLAIMMGMGFWFLARISPDAPGKERL